MAIKYKQLHVQQRLPVHFSLNRFLVVTPIFELSHEYAWCH